LLPDCSQFWSKRGAVFFVWKGERSTRRCLMQPIAGSRRRGEMQTKDKVCCCSKSAPSTVSAAAVTCLDATSPYYLLHKCFTLFHSNDADPPRPLIRRYHPTGAFFPSGKKDFPTDQIFLKARKIFLHPRRSKSSSSSLFFFPVASFIHFPQKIVSSMMQVPAVNSVHCFFFPFFLRRNFAIFRQRDWEFLRFFFKYKYEKSC
jgi:hypothetical protein